MMAPLAVLIVGRSHNTADVDLRLAGWRPGPHKGRWTGPGNEVGRLVRTPRDVDGYGRGTIVYFLPTWFGIEHSQELVGLMRVKGFEFRALLGADVPS